MLNARILMRVLVLTLLAACASQPETRPTPPPVVTLAKPKPPPLPRTNLYGPDEALADVLSSPLEYLGTGRWPGIERSFTCVFRNARVFVVNAYCTPTEAPAARFDVYSPERGYARLYAEANGPISMRDRALYFSFVASAEAPPDAQALGPVALSMSFDELKDYEQKRYDAYLPTCYAGEQNEQPVKGCLGALSSQTEAWEAEHRDFLARASSNWYRVLRMMRELSTEHGKDPL